ncbi:response regulator [Anaerolineales bacterium HSG6]|nr:response regulator [Anaerolineales bacterium HSG6]
MTKTKIMIVEDEAIVALTIERKLEIFGYEVLARVDTGEEAVQQVGEIQPDLLLMDIMLAGEMDGVETAAQIRTRFDIPVIYLTAYADEKTLQRAKVTEPFGYLLKPFEDRELHTTIEMALYKHRMERRLKERTFELEESLTILQERNRELDAFAHTVAHDLQNPLATMIGFAEVLEEDTTIISAQERQEYLGLIARNGHKMSTIIKSLLLLSSVRKQEIKSEPLDMAAVVIELQQRLAGMIDEYQPEIILPEPSAWPVALGYAPWVEEIWTNYFSNALKYGGQPPRVELGANLSENEELVQFWVRDNGPGLTPEEQAKLFVPFTRLNPSRVEGHGLGLSIVRRIAEKLDGQAGVESEVGQGSKFYFTLPNSP